MCPVMSKVENGGSFGKKANKAQQSDLGKLSPFLRSAKMPPSHPNRSARRYRVKVFGVSVFSSPSFESSSYFLFVPHSV